MANYKTLAKEFTQAAWQGRGELEQFVAQAAKLGTADIIRLLPGLRADGVTLQVRHSRMQAFVMVVQGRRKDARLFGPMFRAAKDGDEPLRRVMTPLLTRHNDIKQHRAVCELLRSEDANLRRFAAGLLKEIGGKSALQTLSSLLDKGRWESRAEAIAVAMEIGGHYAIEILAKIVIYGSIGEKLQALQLLGDEHYVRMRRTGAIEAMLPALADPNMQVVGTAIRSIAMVANEDEFLEALGALLEGSDQQKQMYVLQNLASFPTGRVILVVEGVYTATGPAVREAAVRALEGIGNDEALPLLVKALSDEVLSVRNASQEVVVQLGRSGRVDVSTMLLWLLRSPDVNVRRQALEIVKEIGAPVQDLWPRLLRLLRDQDWWVRERVVDVLAEMAGHELTRHVVTYLSDPSDVVRRYAVEVLMRIRDPRALGALVKTASEDEDWWTRERAVECMGAIGDPVVIPHVVKLATQDPDLCFPAVQALGMLKATEGMSFLCVSLGNEDPDVRLEAVRSLRAINDPASANELASLLGDPDPRVADEVRELLTTWQVQMEGSEMAGQIQDRLNALERILLRMVEREADDLFLIPGMPPHIKHMGSTTPLSPDPLTQEQVEALIRPLLSPAHAEALATLHDVDFSTEIKSNGFRFRVNVYQQVRGWTAVFRRINNEIFEFEQLGLPKVVQRLCHLRNGLVLVGGPSGSGKSTTLAAMLDYINRTFAKHIITIEDPIEVVHTNERSMVTQREVGKHTTSLESALRATLREDPDVILVGELRDHKTISFAVSAAETGHLVLGTLHTVSADTTVDRLINSFPVGQQDQVRAMLSQSLRAVLCQQLVPRTDGSGRVIAMEVLLNNDAVSNLIRKGQAYQLPSVIVTSREVGMRSMDHELLRLYRDGIIDADEAYRRAIHKKDFETILASAGALTPGPPGDPAAVDHGPN
jgi:twitching motility protein PilT